MDIPHTKTAMHLYKVHDYSAARPLDFKKSGYNLQLEFVPPSMGYNVSLTNGL